MYFIANTFDTNFRVTSARILKNIYGFSARVM